MGGRNCVMADKSGRYIRQDYFDHVDTRALRDLNPDYPYILLYFMISKQCGNCGIFKPDIPVAAAHLCKEPQTILDCLDSCVQVGYMARDDHGYYRIENYIEHQAKAGPWKAMAINEAQALAKRTSLASVYAGKRPAKSNATKPQDKSNKEPISGLIEGDLGAPDEHTHTQSHTQSQSQTQEELSTTRQATEIEDAPPPPAVEVSPLPSLPEMERKLDTAVRLGWEKFKLRRCARRKFTTEAELAEVLDGILRETDGLPPGALAAGFARATTESSDNASFVIGGAKNSVHKGKASQQRAMPRPEATMTGAEKLPEGLQ